jgi:hypothetical protein
LLTKVFVWHIAQRWASLPENAGGTMDFLEEMVMWNLCARYPSELFFCPQFDIGGGWSYPDFGVLYPKERQVWVVEVTGKASGTKLAKKLKDGSR